ncbi:MAG: hypothetical protein LUE17_13720 [Planctomycetaceae bacterium]|nr:hypothetical protein [Planctomycetaceae bacterium]
MKNLGLVFLPPVNGLPGMEERHVAALRQRVPSVDWRVCADKDETASLLPDAVAALVWAFSSSWNGKAGNLRLIATPAAGRDWIHATPRDGLEILFGHYHGELMAETVLGLMLAFTRGIKDSLDRRGEVWPRVEVGSAMRPLRGSHAVIVGFGNIGKWVGRLLAPMGVRVTGVNRSNLDRPDSFRPDDRVIRLDELDSVLPEADHLVMVLPGDTGTDKLLDARRIGLLRPDAYVYNIGRGNAIDLDALTAALREGRLAGAGLDVYPEEPLPTDAPIRSCPRTILLPHVSAFGPTYFDLWMKELLPALEGIFGKK